MLRIININTVPWYSLIDPEATFTPDQIKELTLLGNQIITLPEQLPSSCLPDDFITETKLIGVK